MSDLKKNNQPDTVGYGIHGEPSGWQRSFFFCEFHAHDGGRKNDERCGKRLQDECGPAIVRRILGHINRKKKRENIQEETDCEARGNDFQNEFLAFVMLHEWKYFARKVPVKYRKQFCCKTSRIITPRIYTFISLLFLYKLSIMKTRTKKILKWTGIIFGSIIVIIIALGAYIFSIIPKPLGKIPELQHELFTKPASPLPVTDSLLYKSATELAAMIRNHQATSAEIVTTYINNIKNNNYKYNALVWLFEADALREARRCDSLLADGTILGPLHGVPMTVKEVYFIKGKYSTLNAKEIGGFMPDYNQKIVEQLKKSGAVIIGTTNVPYMLLDYQTYGDIYPPASNPYDTSCTPGGSTGGGAAALAAGFTPLEVGSDMGGSVRCPSAFCGLYGLKTTEKALDLWDMEYPGMKSEMKYASLAVCGPLARNPEDLELLWNVLRQTPNAVLPPFSYDFDTAKSLNQYRVAWNDKWVFGNDSLRASADIREKLTALIDSLQHHGVTTEKTSPQTYEKNLQLFFAELCALQSSSQPWIIRQLMMPSFKKLDDGKIDKHLAWQLMSTMSPALWDSTLALKKSLVTEWDHFLTDHDFFICPVMLTDAYKKCERGTPLMVDGQEIFYWNNGAFCLSFNALGYPSIVIPLGLDKEGLPVGVQVVGKYFSEPKLIAFAKQLEGITPGFIKPKS